MFLEIEVCEKSLMDYLEQKKKIFARFYFVANQALLDILSNGNNPEIVDNFLADCFDGLKNLQFIRGPSIPYPSKRAEGMISNEGEYVQFTNNFTAAGAVENYLCDLEKCMQVTLTDILVNAIPADTWGIDCKERHIWLEDFPAQIALLATQIIWTEETERAFTDLEQGSENSMKDSYANILVRLGKLIGRVRDVNISMDLRVKIITIITIDVHERDVINKFNNEKIQDA